MATEIVVPALGESVTEATVAQWLKKPGEAVAVDEPLVELETDKVTLEVNATAAGVLAEIAVAEGENVEVGAILGKIGEGTGAAPAAPAPATPAPATPAPAEPAPPPAPPRPRASGRARRAAATRDRSARAPPPAARRAPRRGPRGLGSSPGDRPRRPRAAGRRGGRGRARDRSRPRALGAGWVGRKG